MATTIIIRRFAVLVAAIACMGLLACTTASKPAPVTAPGQKPAVKEPEKKKPRKSAAKRANELMKKGRHKEAREKADEALGAGEEGAGDLIKQLEKLARVENMKAEKAFARGDMRTAHVHWSESLAMDPGRPGLSEKVRNVGALLDAQDAFEAERYSDTYHSAMSAKDYGLTMEGAVELLAKLRRLAGKHYTRGLDHYVEERMEQAIAEWERALEIYPGHSNAARDLREAEKLREKIEKVK